MSEVARVLNAIRQGDPHAVNELLPLVYGELRKLAAQRMDSEKAGQTLQPTALVHEAYLRLVGAGQERHWDGRGHWSASHLAGTPVESTGLPLAPMAGCWHRLAIDSSRPGT